MERVKGEIIKVGPQTGKTLKITLKIPPNREVTLLAKPQTTSPRVMGILHLLHKKMEGGAPVRLETTLTIGKTSSGELVILDFPSPDQYFRAYTTLQTTKPRKKKKKGA